MQFSDEEKERYVRHFSLSQVGEVGQLRLKSSRVLIIGAGGLGSPIALYLAAAGVGNLTIIDPDIVSLSNLQRQVLFSHDDIGSLKALSAKNNLLSLNPSIHVDAISEAFSKANGAELIRRHDLIIDGTDNFETRYLVNDLCVAENKAFIFGAIYRFDAQISVFHYKGGPCYRCLYPNAPPLEAVSNCSEAGVLGVLPGTVGTLMANEALKILLNIGEVTSGKLLIYDSLRTEIYKRKLNRNVDCMSCGEGPLRNVLADVLLSPKMQHLTLKEIENIEEFFILDVRQESEFKAKHLPYATNIALPELKEKSADIPRDQKLLLVCKSGKRSRRAGEILDELGFLNLFQLDGGMDKISGVDLL